ncbi:MAG: hypothetical protein ACPGNV_08085 [Mangrovicoccus sp.]
MFDAQHADSSAGPMTVANLGHLAREAGLNIDVERTHISPVLFWFTSGQGRLRIDGELRGYTAHNALFLPANTPYALEITNRTQGSAVFFANQTSLPFPKELMHLRLHGVQLQSQLNALIEDLHEEARGDAADRDQAMHHRAALTLIWLARNSGKRPPQGQNVTDVLRALARPGY